MPARALDGMSFLVLLLTMLVSQSHAGDVYDAYADFDPAANPTAGNVWRYGYSPGLGGPITTFPDHATDATGNQVWLDNAHQSLGAPVVFRNASSAPHGIVPPHSLGFQPGPAGSGFDVCNILWTAPAAAPYDLSATFTDLDSGSRTVAILLRGIPLFSTDLTGNGTSTSYSNILSHLYLDAGDTIDFAVAPVGSFTTDSTRLSASITAIPESSCVLSLAMLAAFRRPPNRSRKRVPDRH